jgi:2-polyprenyl-3-methyl-5-hydroxy-6-metoxy-1,4-benzoquinol methylase
MLECLNLENIKGKVILDVGCSYGFVAQHLRLLGAEAFGLDVDSKALKEGPVKKYCIHGDALHLPMKNEGLDAIIAFELMEHLTDPNKALTAFCKCLKKRRRPSSHHPNTKIFQSLQHP